MATSKIGSVMIEIVMGVILIVIGLAMAAPLNSTITNMTTGANATAQGAAAVSMWDLVPLLFGVLLLLIPLGSVIKSFRNR
jgi:galactitol-specific phosphotransferase system IIC component